MPNARDLGRCKALRFSHPGEPPADEDKGSGWILKQFFDGLSGFAQKCVTMLSNYIIFFQVHT